jgi:AcrR family transcriptional regulator
VSEWPGRDEPGTIRNVTTGGRREVNRRRTGERIYAAAMKLYERDGFENVTVHMIADAAGVSVPTFYAHYSSREIMLMPLPEREEIGAVLASQPMHIPPTERARNAILIWLELIDRHQREAVLERWRIIATTPSLRLRTAGFERATAAVVLGALSEEKGEKMPPAVEVGINALMSAYTQIVLRWADTNGSRDLLEIAREVLEELRGQL